MPTPPEPSRGHRPFAASVSSSAASPAPPVPHAPSEARTTSEARMTSSPHGPSEGRTTSSPRVPSGWRFWRRSGPVRVRPPILLLFIYLAFISLGLPDSVAGVAWPSMRAELGAPLEKLGLISGVVLWISAFSSATSGFVAQRLGTGLLTALSCLCTALGLLGYALAPSLGFVLLCALPLGLGQGAVDSGLNLYVARHYSARHMNWLHSFWGVGATLGPLIMTLALANLDWRWGYGALALLQALLGVCVGLSILPGWWGESKRRSSTAVTTATDQTNEAETASDADCACAMTRSALDDGDACRGNDGSGETSLDKGCAVNASSVDACSGDVCSDNVCSGAACSDDVCSGDASSDKAGEACRCVAAPVAGRLWQTGDQLLGVSLFFFYSGIEFSLGIWLYSFLLDVRHLGPSEAGLCVALFYGSIMGGRLLAGVVAPRLGNERIIRLGLALAMLGVIWLWLWPGPLALAGAMLNGLGLAPVYPGLMYETPRRFTEAVTGRLVGFQVGAACLGSSLVAGAVGLVLARWSLDLLCPLVGSLLVLAVLMNEVLARRARRLR